jgi:DNA modification methylase
MGGENRRAAGPSHHGVPSRESGRIAPRIAVTIRQIDELKLDPGNARRHSKKQIGQIANSIATFGFNVPVLVDAALKVIAGHGRLLACRQLGWTEIPTISHSHLSDAQARAFSIADNRLSETAIWDDRILAHHLKDLSLLNLDFSLEVTGFDMPEIDLRIGSLDTETETTEDRAEAAPARASGPAVSKMGDLWILGDHRVLCGSALDTEACQLLMGDHRATLVFTEPPYTVPIVGHTSGRGTIRHRAFPMPAGGVEKAEFNAFLVGTCRNLARFSKEGSLHFICTDWRRLEDVLAAGREAYAELLDLCVWVKGNAGVGSFYRSQHELVGVFKYGNGQYRSDHRLRRLGRNRTNVWHYPEANSRRGAIQAGSRLVRHPTIKPVAMVADAILDCSNRHDIVLDGFLGDGTTLIASQRTGRRCCGMELDPAYVDAIVRRWQQLAGKSARHAESGRCFDDLAHGGEVGHAS